MTFLGKVLRSIAVGEPRLNAAVGGLSADLDQLRISQGMLLDSLNEAKRSKDIKDYEHKVFSQWGEDGIIQHLIRVVKIPNKSFVEFGIQDFTESNCRYLLMKDNWSGFVIDGSRTNIARLQQSYFYWRYDLVALDAFITRENINELISKSGFGSKMGILSIDIDGNDYWVWEAIHASPAIVIVEYNSRFGPDRAVTIPYKAQFIRTDAHFSNIYYGASLSALCLLGERKGYDFVGCNSAGNNAFFVRHDLRPDELPKLTPQEGFVRAKFRESRAADGKLTFMNSEEEIRVLKELPLVEIV